MHAFILALVALAQASPSEERLEPWASNHHATDAPKRHKEEIVSSAITPKMTDKEKATALWFQRVTHRYHFSGGADAESDLVKSFHIFGYNSCGHDAMCMAGVWLQAGLKVAPVRGFGHCISQ